MSENSWTLKPFPDESIDQSRLSPGLVAVKVWRDGERLCFEYRLSRLSSGFANVRIPEPASPAERRDGLWKTTCFEAFFGDIGSTEYWELNVSPSLDWNLYRFENYRSGMAREERIELIERDWRTAEDGLELRCAVDLSRLGLHQVPIELSATAVIEHLDGAESFWAIEHGGDRPDFHLRNSFVVQL